MEYNIFIVKGLEIYDISEFVSNITWSDSIDTLGMQLDFNVVVSNDRYFPKFSVEVGDIVILRNEFEIFRGIIVTKNFNGISEVGITAFDFCFYLNKSKIIKQFNSINASLAISQLCSEVNIKVGSIDSMRSLIKHIYYNKTIAEIIEDILEQETQETGKKYIKEMQGDSFYIFERTAKPITATFKPAINIEPFDVTLAIGNLSKTLSIEEMKNSIMIISGDEKSVRVLAIAKDEAGIQKYGLLQEVESIDDKDKNKVQNIADNKLKELNKIKESLNITLLGDNRARAGRVLSLIEENTNINGKYLIKSCNHSISGGNHTMTLELEMIV